MIDGVYVITQNGPKYPSYTSQLWAELHAQENPTPEWFEDWLSRIPRYRCSCQQDFRAYVKDNPPDFSNFYAWSVDAHNWVNAKRGAAIWKPLD